MVEYDNLKLVFSTLWSHINPVSRVDGLKYWQSEYSILENTKEKELPGASRHQGDLGMKTALFFTRLIHNDIAVAGASSCQWWTALSRADFKDGLIYLDDGTNNGSMAEGYCKNDGFFRESKLLWALGNYSYFVRPGMVRVALSDTEEKKDSNALMFKDTAKRKIVIVAVNTTDTEQFCRLKMDKFKIKDLTPYTTSENANLTKGKAIKGEHFKVPGKAVFTYRGEY